MKIILHEENTYVLRLDRGEELMGSLKAFCGAENVSSGYFSAIGATEEITIAYYDLDKKEYQDRSLAERLEIAGLNGTIALLEKEPFIHAHGNFSDAGLRTYSGHVKKLIVSATCEIILNKFKNHFSRKFDKDTGLNVLS